VAEGVCIADPPRGQEILAALREIQGTAVSIPEGEIALAQRELALKEGIYIEPTSAVAMAALRKLVAQGVIRPGEAVVVPLTGSGLKASALEGWGPWVSSCHADRGDFRHAR